MLDHSSEVSGEGVRKPHARRGRSPAVKKLFPNRRRKQRKIRALWRDSSSFSSFAGLFVIRANPRQLGASYSETFGGRCIRLSSSRWSSHKALFPPSFARHTSRRVSFRSITVSHCRISLVFLCDQFAAAGAKTVGSSSFFALGQRFQSFSRPQFSGRSADLFTNEQRSASSD